MGNKTFLSPCGNTEALAFTSGSSAQTTATCPNGCFAVTIFPLGDNVFIETGTNPTASTTTSQMIAANISYTRGIAPGDKVAVRGSTGSGTAYITFMA